METEHQRTRDRTGHDASIVLMGPGGVLGGGRYELRGLLGRGGMAEVRDGWDLKLSRPVAIKLLHPGVAAWPENRLRFETEARAAAMLSSRHIVVVHDIGEHDGLPFIVMERLPGVSLAHHIARGPLPPAFVQAVLDDVLAALAVAHGAGILHRDIKPGNILFTAAGEPKLADFGIAKTTGAAYTKTGYIAGTIAYMSPERLTGRAATAADDLYAVGVVGYYALTGRRPFPQDDLGALTHAILHESPPSLATLRPDVRPGLTTVIERAMARDPAQRFEQASAMRAALAGADPASIHVRPATRIMEAPLPTLPTYAPAGAPLEPANRRRKLLWTAAIIATLLMAIMLLAVDQPFTAPPTPTSTSTPSPPPTTTTTTTADRTTAQSPKPPQPPPPGNHPGKKPKGGHGDGGD
jgi:serine/threonine protein kinase